MKSFKTLVRSVSPFTTKSDKKRRSESDIGNVSHVNNGFKTYMWDLSDVNLLEALSCFYQDKNADKVNIVPKI